MTTEPPKTKPSSLRRLPRNVWALTVTSLLTDVSSEMVSNILPLFLFNVLGVQTSVIGLIEGLAETTSSLLKVFSGWLSDRLRTRKWLAVMGYAVSTLSKPLLYFATTWGWVLTARFGDRTGKGLRTSPRDALLADSVEPDQRGLAYGLHRAGDTAGAAIGLLVALAIVHAVQRQSAQLTRETFQVVVLVGLIPAALAVLVLALAAADIPGAMGKPSTLPTRPKLGPAFRNFLIIMFIFSLGNSSDAFLILRAQDAGLGVTGVLGMMLSFNLVYTLVSTPAGALSDRIGRRALLVGGWLLYTLVYLGFARAQAGWQTWALMIPYGIYYASTEGVAKAFVADLVPAEQRGFAFGVFNASIGLTALPASLIAGLLWQGLGNWPGLGPSAPFIFGAVLASLAALLLFVVVQPAANRTVSA